MQAVRNYIYAINGWDAEQMAEAFCEDGIFDDKAYELLTGQVGYFVGRDAIKAMFAGLFENKPHGLIIKWDAANKKAYYNVTVGDTVIPCIGTLIEEKDGKLKHYRVDVGDWNC